MDRNDLAFTSGLHILKEFIDAIPTDASQNINWKELNERKALSRRIVQELFMAPRTTPSSENTIPDTTRCAPQEESPIPTAPQAAPPTAETPQ